MLDTGDGDRVDTDQSDHNERGADGVPLKPHVVINTLDNLSRRLNQLREDYHLNKRHTSDIDLNSVPVAEGFGLLVKSTREMLTKETAEHLHQVERDICGNTNLADPRVRLKRQSNIFTTANMLRNMAAYLVELSQTLAGLHLGRSLSQLVLNQCTAPLPYLVSSEILPQSGRMTLGTIPIAERPNSETVDVNSLGKMFCPAQSDNFRGENRGTANRSPGRVALRQLNLSPETIPSKSVADSRESNSTNDTVGLAPEFRRMSDPLSLGIGDVGTSGQEVRYPHKCWSLLSTKYNTDVRHRQQRWRRCVAK